MTGWMTSVVEAFNEAKAVWLATLEQETSMYGTEVAEFKAIYPMPTMAKFMRDYAREVIAEQWCVLVNAPGETLDDCLTHDHEMRVVA